MRSCKIARINAGWSQAEDKMVFRFANSQTRVQLILCFELALTTGHFSRGCFKLVDIGAALRGSPLLKGVAGNIPQISGGAPRKNVWLRHT